MRKWDILTPIGVALGFALIYIAISMGSGIGLFFSLSSFFITVGGSFAALLVNYRWAQIVNVFKTLKKVMTTDPLDKEQMVKEFIDLAKKARKEGILGLEEDLEQLHDRFLQKGIRLVIDGLDPKYIEEILETDLEATAYRHQVGQGVFKKWGMLTPAFGMIGTLIGLIQMLSQLNDPSSLGPAMALALITTFYGVLLANLVLIPIAGKLELISDEEMMLKRMIISGVMGIQKGINPRILEEKLQSYIQPDIKEEKWKDEMALS